MGTYAFTVVRFAFTACAVAVLVVAHPVAAGAVQTAPADQLNHANRLFLDRFGEIEKSGGHELTTALARRMIDDWASVAQKTPPSNYTGTNWTERVSTIVSLDSDLIAELLGGRTTPILDTPGLHEYVMRMTYDGTLQPFAVYIPATYHTMRDPSIVMLLHGQPQTEVELLSAPYFRTLADQSGSIVVAPWGRGLYDFSPPADSEVYELLDHVLATFPIDRRHVYLAGYSMGGFSVFKVGPLHGERWAAILCIAGAILPDEADTVGWRLRNTPFYVVNGKNDSSIPAKYGEMTVAFLQNSDIPVSFYQEPDGEHWLSSLVPSLSRAWSDMLAGVAHTTDAKYDPKSVHLPVIHQSTATVMKP